MVRDWLTRSTLSGGGSSDRPAHDRVGEGTNSDAASIGIHKGSNQSGMRDHNERLVLSLLRWNADLSKADIAKISGLSAQTVSVIVRALEADGFIRRGTPVKGKRGQPSVPLSLDPGGAYFLGLKVGRRTAEFVLVDFTGTVLAIERRSYAYPVPGEIVQFVKDSHHVLMQQLSLDKQAKISGLGIAIPFELWNWAADIGAPEAEMDAWRSFNIREELSSLFDFPIYLENDATSACGAELVFGRTRHPQDFMYFFVGTFVGGGVVLNGGLYPGKSGYAGVFGPMPVPGRNGHPERLIDQASLRGLEVAVVEAGLDPSLLWDPEADWSPLHDHLEAWLPVAAQSLAYATLSAACVIEFEATLIDGVFPEDVRERLVDMTEQHFQAFDLQGVHAPRIAAGSIGHTARALGAASLPLVDRYLIDQNTLLRSG